MTRPLRPHPSRAHLEEHQREARSRASATSPRAGHPIVGSGPFVLTEPTARASSSGSRPTPTTSSARPRSVRSSSACSAARTRWRRRCAAARSTSPTLSTPTSSQSLQGVKRASPAWRRSTPASTSSPSTPAQRWTTGRRSATATPPSRTRRSASRSPTPSTRRRCSKRSLQGRGEIGSSIIPPIYPNLHYDPGASAITYRRRRRRTRCSTRLATPRARRHRATARTASPSSSACSPARSSQTSKQTTQFLQGWLKDDRYRVQRQDHVERHPHRDHRPGQLRHVRVGLGRRARPRLPAVDVHLRQALLQGRRAGLRRPLGLLLLQQGVRHAVRRAGEDRRTRMRAPRSSSTCRRWSTTTRRTSSRTTTTTSRPTAPTSGATSRRSPPDAAYSSSSTAPTPTATSSCRPTSRPLLRQPRRRRRPAAAHQPPAVASRRATPAATPTADPPLGSGSWWRSRPSRSSLERSSWVAARVQPLRTTKSRRGGRTS